MKKEEFLAALAAELRDLSKEDIARSLEYYGEMIDDRVEDGMSVERAIDDLGGVETVARQIMEELPRERRAFGESLRGGLNRELDCLDQEMDALGKRMDELGKEMSTRYAEAYGDGGNESDGESLGVYSIDEPFRAVDIQVGSADVRVMRSRDGETHIETSHDDSVIETVEVRSGVLSVRHTPAYQPKKSSLFGLKIRFAWHDEGKVAIWLADKLWESVAVKTTSGDVEAEDVRAGTLSLSSKSGDVEARHLTVEGRLSAESMSGDVTAEAVTAGEMSLGSMSGDVEADAAEAGSITMRSKSGEIDLEDVLAHGVLEAESISGDVTLRRSDAGELILRSTSGDIDGTLLTPKDFHARSVSGDVRVPSSQAEAGRCEASTASGDVSLRIAP